MIWGFISLKNRCGDKFPGKCKHRIELSSLQPSATEKGKSLKRINWSPECIYGMRRSIIINVFLIVGAFR
ncbi:hypothetical protein X798_01399, partial [Onchocerca flexuosa]